MKKYKSICFQVFWLSVFASGPKQSWSQGLSLPSGKFSIGHHRFEWTDTTRTEILAETLQMRRVVADVWYPAENSSGASVPYLDTVTIYRAFGIKGLQSLIGAKGAAIVRSGIVKTHARENAAFDRRLRLAPVIFFSHGMGMIPQLYTTQIEDLVSHGYIVVALLHPYDAWLVSFTDGTQIFFETKHRKAAGSTEKLHIAYENKRIEWWAADIRFALDQLILINNMKTDSIPFAGRLDVSRVGALGHSSGGRAAARACQLDARIKSCADQDGVAMMQPFYLGSDGVGMKQPFLLFERVRNVAPDEADAASLGMTLPELNALVDRLRRDKRNALAATGGSYHVLLQFDSSSHMSFSDLPLLQAKNESESAAARRVLQATCRYTRDFFDKTLRAATSTVYDSGRRLNYIELVEKYSKARNKKSP
jgi:predicted dienelactone hydrolase